ncbi:hypothetical protein [Streptomyces sp. or20]|uniref:hypothetical protein n=1 Tax=Streptomyces sp. or20 TaxID=1828016 RepID=UPI000BF14495|nr:hypothetical protein [Streptomyces sp. or20]
MVIPRGPVVCRSFGQAVVSSGSVSQVTTSASVIRIACVSLTSPCWMTWKWPRWGALLGAGGRGQDLPGVGRKPRQDHRGEQLAGRSSKDGGLGSSVEDDVDAGRAPAPERFLEGGDGRRRLRVVLLPEGLPVAGEAVQRGVSFVDRDDQAGHGVQVAVEVEAALQLGGKAEEGVVDAGDVAAVGDRGQALRPQVGDPFGVQDQGVGALVKELGGQGPQHGGAAAAAGGADQDVRRIAVQVDGNGPPGGADADEGGSLGQRLYLRAQVRLARMVGFRSQRGNQVRHRCYLQDMTDEEWTLSY